MKKSRKILSLLLCCMLLVGLLPTVAFATTTYNVWVDGGTQVTSDNAADILGDGTASYDAAKNELTLSGYDGSYIKAYMALDIVLAYGTENTVSVAADVAEFGIYTDGDCTISGNGNLNIEVLHPDRDGVWAEYGDLTVDMTGDLTVNAGDEGLYADNDLTVSGSGDITVTTVGGDGFYADSGNLTVSGSGDITVTAHSNGFHADSGDVTISGSGDITVTAYSNGFYADSGDVTISGSGGITVTAGRDGISAYGNVRLSGSRNINITAGDNGISADGNVKINDTCKVSVDASAGGYYAVYLRNSGKSVRLNGTGAPISLKAGTGVAAVWNRTDSNSPVGGTNIANYDVTGAPDTASVVYTLKSGAPIKITEIAISNADITPVAGEKAGDHMAYTLPTDCHYAATMNGWWDILGSKIMDSDDEFEAGGLYCASWNFVADDGYAFAADATVTINGSAANVDAEHSYLDTTGDAPLYIVSAKGVLVEAATYTVNFDANGHGTAPASQTVESGKTATKPADPTASGWSFGGWYQETACTNAYDFETPVTADITVYAKWTKKPSVLFGDANGDGTVDSKDLSLLRKYMASYDYTTGTSTVAVQPGADANGDGTIDSKDLSILRKYMAAYDYTTGTSTVVLGPSK